MSEHKEETVSPGEKPQPEQSPKGMVTRSLQLEEKFSGPIPPPNLLKKYDEIVPGAAERILSMAERQSEHRIYLEKFVVKSDSKRADSGLVAGLVVALTALIIAGILIYTGHDVAGTIVGSLDLVALVGVFVYGSLNRRAEREKKSKLMKLPDQKQIQPKQEKED
jgi:uncharacterized membrane protein